MTDLTDAALDAPETLANLAFHLRRMADLSAEAIDADRLCRAAETIDETVALRAERDAALALAASEYARGVNDAVAWHIAQAEQAMGSLSCGSENRDFKEAGRLNDWHRDAAAAIRAMKGGAS